MIGEPHALARELVEVRGDHLWVFVADRAGVLVVGKQEDKVGRSRGGGESCRMQERASGQEPTPAKEDGRKSAVHGIIDGLGGFYANDSVER